MKSLVAFLLTVLVSTSCGQAPVPPPPVPVPDPPVVVEPAPPTQTELDALEIETLLSSMSVEEQVGQLFFVRCPSDLAVEDIATYHLGGYILFGRDTVNETADSLQQTLQTYQEAAKIPLLLGVDEEGGTVVRISSNPNLAPSRGLSPQRLYAKGGLEAIEADTIAKTHTLQALGFNVNLAPVADVSTSKKDFIYSRSFGQDGVATATYVETVVGEMDGLSMASVLKHFPGYGTNIDTHTGIAVDNRSIESFETSDFLPFKAGIAAGNGTTSILVSHNIITAVDKTLPASLSPAVLTWLRTSLEFDGVVMTDDLAMDAVSAYAKDGNVSTMALLAGNDVVITSDYRTQIPKTLEAVENGTLSKEQIETACGRVLSWKQQLGLL